MSKSKSLRRTPAENAGVLKTDFVTQNQTAALTKIVEVSLEQLDGMGGGLASVKAEECACCHKPHAL
jgi:hypothetical protein